MSHSNKNGTLIVRIMCAIFFLLFTFAYIYEYQTDILSVTQYSLSRGATHYVRFVGAFLITLVLWLIQLGIYVGTGLCRNGHALTYLPSLLLLGILTDVSSDIQHLHYLGNWIWLFPLLIVVYAIVVWMVRQLESMEHSGNSIGVFSRMTWFNLLQMVLMSLVACGIGCSDQVFHYRMKIENCLINRDFSNAAIIGMQSAKTDSSLVMLRMWALSEQGMLGDKLFDYPLIGGSDAILPNGTSVQLLMVSESLFYKRLGCVFKQRMNSIKYLETLHEKKKATHESHDWLLCAYLLDRKLDAFIDALPQYYKVDENLPRSYKEALVLYNHTHKNPHVVFKNEVLDTDYHDFISLARSMKNPQERLAALKDNYGKTYWFYYLSSKS